MADISFGTTLKRQFPSHIVVVLCLLCITSANSQRVGNDMPISIGALVGIIVGGLIFLTGIPILCCFCCACCCFSGRSKSKTNVFVNAPGQTTTNQMSQQNTTFQNTQQYQDRYPHENQGQSSYPSQHQYPYPSNRDIHNSPNHQPSSYPQISSYPQDLSYPNKGPSYPPNSPSYPYPQQQSRLAQNPPKLPPYSPMNHSRVATPLVSQMSPYPSPNQGFNGAPQRYNPSVSGIHRSHSSAGHGSSQPLYPSNLTPSALGLQRSPSYLGAGPSQPFYPHHNQSSGLRRSPSVSSPTGQHPSAYYDNNAYNPDVNRGYGFQNKY